jgi:hypothetical protein
MSLVGAVAPVVELDSLAYGGMRDEERVALFSKSARDGLWAK